MSKQESTISNVGEMIQVTDGQVHSARITVVEYAQAQGMSRTQMKELLDMATGEVKPAVLHDERSRQRHRRIAAEKTGEADTRT